MNELQTKIAKRLPVVADNWAALRPADVERLLGQFGARKPPEQFYRGRCYHHR